MNGESGSAIVGGGGQRSHSADDLASAVGGRVIGDGGAVVRAIAPLDRAGEHDLSFLSSSRYAPLFEHSLAGVVLVPPDLADAAGRARARIVVERPHEALLSLIPRFYVPPERRPGIRSSVQIGRGASLGAEVSLEHHVVIGEGARIGARSWLEAGVVVGEGVEIGEDTRIHAGVTLYPGTRIGDRVQIHAGARIGSDGYGYVQQGGRHVKIPHVGRCIVQDDVEIGANTTIDRGSIDDTVVGAGTKIDNLVQVGHNVRIGRACLIMAQVGIAGSAHIEDGCIVAGQAGIGGHVVIGAGARIAGQSGVFGDVPAGASWSGYPARPHREALRAQAALFRLSGLMKRIERMLTDSER